MTNRITEIRFTKADHLYGLSGGFIDLGGITHDDPDALQEIWDGLEEIEADPKHDDFNLIADQWCGDNGVTANKYVPAETIEYYLRRPLADAEADGYAEIEALEAMIAAR